MIGLFLILSVAVIVLGGMTIKQGNSTNALEARIAVLEGTVYSQAPTDEIASMSDAEVTACVEDIRSSAHAYSGLPILIGSSSIALPKHPHGYAEHWSHIQLSPYFAERDWQAERETTSAEYWRALRAQDIALPLDLVNALTISWHQAGIGGTRIDQPVEELAAAVARYYWRLSNTPVGRVDLPLDLVVILTRIWHGRVIAS